MYGSLGHCRDGEASRPNRGRNVLQSERNYSDGSVFIAYAKQKGVNKHAIRCLLDGVLVPDEDTPLSLMLKENDQIDVMLVQNGGKPVILLYLTKATDVTVRVQLSSSWRFSALYPTPWAATSIGEVSPAQEDRAVSTLAVQHVMY